LELLEQLPGETNSVIAKWKNLGLKTKSAFQTQALLELKQNYCANKKCLNCNIGNQIVKTKVQ